MAFHSTLFGAFGAGLPADMNGFVPQEGDDPFGLAFDHGGEQTHEEDGGLTAYGEWWEKEGFPEMVARAEEAVARAERSLAAWRKGR